MKKLYKISTIICAILFLFAILSVDLPAQTPQSVQEVDNIQSEALSQIENELNMARQDLETRKQKEMEVIQASEIEEKKKENLLKKIEDKYFDLGRELETKFNTKRKSLISYYTNMKEEILASMPKSKGGELPEKEVIFVPPQKLIGKWQISADKYLGTLRFDNHKGLMISRVWFFMYNKWDDVFNLTYDGQNLAFDYENPYGIKLHFEGEVDPKVKEIKGQFFDLKTDQVYSWKAYR
ncbi:MAG: hypothetical protein AB1782_03060 [Cyanobacteriota bacterium]